MENSQEHDDVLYRHSRAIDRFEQAHVTKAFFLEGAEGVLPSDTSNNNKLDENQKVTGETTTKNVEGVRADVKNSMMTLCLGNEEKELKQIESKAYREFVLNELPIFETKHHEFKMRHRSYGISEADGTAKGESFLATKSPKKSPKPPNMMMSSIRSPRKTMTSSSVFTEEYEGETHYGNEHQPEIERATASLKDALKKYKKINKKKNTRNRMAKRRQVMGPSSGNQEQQQAQQQIQQQIQEQQKQKLNKMPSIEKNKNNHHKGRIQSTNISPTLKQQKQLHKPIALKIQTHVPNLEDESNEENEDEEVPSVVDEANFQNHVRKMKEAFVSFFVHRKQRNDLNAELRDSEETQSITVPASDGHLKNTIQQAMTKKFTDLNEETVKTINFPVQLFGPSISKSKHEGKDSLDINQQESGHMFDTWQGTMIDMHETSNVRMRREMHMDDLEEMSEWANNESFAKPLKRDHADTTEAAAQKLMRECLENARLAQTNLSRMMATEYSLLFDGFTKMDINKDSTLSTEDIRSFCNSHKCSKILQIRDIETMIWNYDDYRRGNISFHDVQQGYSLIREEMIELVSNDINLQHVYDDDKKYLKNTDICIPFRRQSYSWLLPRILLFVALMDESGNVHLLSAYQRLIESLSYNASFMFKFIFSRDDVTIKDSDSLTIKQFLKESKKLDTHRLKSRPLREVERRFLYEYQLKNSPEKPKK